MQRKTTLCLLILACYSLWCGATLTAHAQPQSSQEIWRRWNLDPQKGSLSIPEQRYGEVYDHVFWFVNRIKSKRIVFIDVGCAIGDYLQHVNRLAQRPVLSVGIDPVDWPGRIPYSKFLKIAIAPVAKENVPFNLYGSSDLASSSLKRLKRENVTHNGLEAGNKFYHPAPIEGAKGGTTVTTKPLSQVIAEEGIKDQIDLLKVDTQGTDLEVTLSAGNSLSKILFIQIESILSEKPGHLLYDEQTNFAKDRAVLESKGFEVFNVAAFPAGPEGDVMFVNRKLFDTLAKRDAIPVF
jgi:Methyltransferase FkbM domain